MSISSVGSAASYSVPPAPQAKPDADEATESSAERAREAVVGEESSAKAQGSSSRILDIKV